MGLREWQRKMLLEVDDAYRSKGLQAAREAARRYGYWITRADRVEGGVHLYLEDRSTSQMKIDFILEIYDDGKTYYRAHTFNLADITPGRWRYSYSGKGYTYYPR